MQADIVSACVDVPATLVWSSGQMSGTMSPVTTARDDDPAGLLNEADAEFVASASYSDIKPGLRQMVQDDYGVRYYVDSIETDAAAVRLRLRRLGK